MKNILVIGTGEIGVSLADLIEESGQYKVFRKDIDPLDISVPIHIMHICIPYSERFVEIVKDYAVQYKPKLIIVNSTVRPGTTNKVTQETNISSVHSPVRGRHPLLKEDLLKFIKFVGGEKEAVKKAKEHFESIGITVVSLDNTINSEVGKLLSTTYYAMNITVHREFHRLCEEIGADFSQAVSLFNATSTIDIGHKIPRPLMFPSKIKGHCLIPNIDILKHDVKSELLDFVLKTNEEVDEKKMEHIKEKIKEIDLKYRKGIEQNFFKKIKENASV
tara:strand:+ start:485 stop:1312 length:828 start_codon:yes stop_codon:yes gene_type:complete